MLAASHFGAMPHCLLTHVIDFRCMTCCWAGACAQNSQLLQTSRWRGAANRPGAQHSAGFSLMQEHLWLKQTLKHTASRADLKGDNVMVKLDGVTWTARLMDLGMARAAAPGPGAPGLPLRIRGYAGCKAAQLVGRGVWSALRAPLHMRSLLPSPRAAVPRAGWKAGW